MSIIGLGYGINPNFYPNLFGYEINNLNSFHVFRAFNGLYLSLSAFWIYSAFNIDLKKTAILSIIVVMVGLIIGRIWSLIVDGFPHWLLMSYLGLEIFVLAQACFVYFKKYK